jgi:hypothetical protein
MRVKIIFIDTVNTGTGREAAPGPPLAGIIPQKPPREHGSQGEKAPNLVGARGVAGPGAYGSLGHDLWLKVGPIQALRG